MKYAIIIIALCSAPPLIGCLVYYLAIVENWRHPPLSWFWREVR